MKTDNDSQFTIRYTKPQYHVPKSLGGIDGHFTIKPWGLQYILFFCCMWLGFPPFFHILKEIVPIVIKLGNAILYSLTLMTIRGQVWMSDCQNLGKKVLNVGLVDIKEIEPNILKTKIFSQNFQVFAKKNFCMLLNVEIFYPFKNRIFFPKLKTSSPWNSLRKETLRVFCISCHLHTSHIAHRTPTFSQSKSIYKLRLFEFSKEEKKKNEMKFRL